MTRICFCNPFGTDQFDDLVEETLQPYLRAGTTIESVHVENCPRNIDYYLPKHLVETELFKVILEAEQDGFDAFIIGCCYDPGLTVAREITSMPVIGPLEAAIGMVRPFGQRFSVVTDHRKAVPELEDLVRKYGAEANCRSVRAIDWYVDDMVKDPAAVARDAHEKCAAVMEADGAEAIILGCTIIAACYEKARLENLTDLEPLPIVNPNVMAVKLAETLADLSAVGQYRMGRSGYYQKHAQHDPDEAREVLETFLGSPTVSYP